MVGKIIEKLLFKVRYIYFYETGTCSRSMNVLCYPMSEEIAEFLANYRTSDRLRDICTQRKNEPQWRVFVFFEETVIQGYSLLHVPNEIDWHDSLPTLEGEARECFTFVEPEFRSRGVRSELLSTQKEYCRRTNKKFWAVVEKSNLASVKSTVGNGGNLVRNNILVKVMGTNLVSIVTRPLKCHFLFRTKRSLRQRFLGKK